MSGWIFLYVLNAAVEKLKLQARAPVTACMHESHIVHYPMLQWEKLKLEAEAAALQECTFAPKSVAKNRRHLAGYVPIQERLGELQRRRRYCSYLCNQACFG